MTMNQIIEAYNYFSNQIIQILLLQNDTSYKMDLIDLNINETSLKDGSVEIEMTAVGGWPTVGNYIAFGEEDYWYWGFDQGKCGNFTGGIPSDASDELQFRFNHPIVVLGPGIFTSVGPEFATGYEYDDPNNPGPYCDAKIFYFYSATQPLNPCLYPLELNFYLSTFDYIVNDKRPSPNLTFKNVEVCDDVIPDGSHNGNHTYYLYYGIFTPSGGHE
jgi:hypothetical protein